MNDLCKYCLKRYDKKDLEFLDFMQDSKQCETCYMNSCSLDELKTYKEMRFDIFMGNKK